MSIVVATLGSALVASSLCGSTWRAVKNVKPASAAQIALSKEGHRLFDSGEYSRARPFFRLAALRAESDGTPSQAALSWINAGAAALARLDYRDALPDFLKAKRIAETSGLSRPLAMTMSNLASLYLQMGDLEAAVRAAKDGLSIAAVERTGELPWLRFQMATALAQLHHFDEAEPLYRQAIDDMAEGNNFETTARILGNFGNDCVRAGRLDEAEDVLSEALLLVRLHHLDDAAANILRSLAKLKDRQGDQRSARALFDAAIQASPGITPRWLLYADRGDFRLNRNDLRGALADFREARRFASQMRRDTVPADLSRVNLESGLTRASAGLIAAGNRLARQTSDASLLRETFDAAEQDRLWSLRSLLPAPNDWRTRLPKKYWDLLAQYQALERDLLAHPSADLAEQASALREEMQQIQATAASRSGSRIESESALAHANRVLSADSVLLSFYVTQSGGWLWAVDQQGVDVYPAPSLETLKNAVADFRRAVTTGNPNSLELGCALYQLLFGNVSTRYLSRKRWLLELDGPLFDLPFAALVVDPGKADPKKQNEPNYLFQRKILQAIPGALMLEHPSPSRNGIFLGIGDPIYSPADSRYQGDRTKHEVVLPRLPATEAEVEACSRAWNPARARLLTGPDARLTTVQEALRSNPSIIHFATHVVTAPEDHSSGLIALSLDRKGAMGFIGPAEIAAYTLTPSLVVLNGCHSAQGEALPSAGLMGLTRAWLGAGARSVLATRWDIPDDAGEDIMVDFYRTFRAQPDRGPAFALQQAQGAFLRSHPGGNATQVWGAYFVLGRE
jgi:CHAT domain-containing protein/Tfp pilus assembly protein PilF